VNVDTGEFRRLTEQAADVAALGRKISTLTGRVTVMGNHLNRLDGLVDDDLRMLVRIMEAVLEASGMMPRTTAVRAAARSRKMHPARDHLRVIQGGGQ
jgi:hypothetical protein